MTPLHFQTPRLDSKKNRGKVVGYGRPCPTCGRRPRTGYRPSDKAMKQEKALRDRLAVEFGPDPTFGDHDVRVIVEHLAREDMLSVTVEDIRPRPKGFSGRRRDLPNVTEALLDAMEGPILANDNQVADLRVIRVV